jgi:tRNA-splicing ligase RtcB
VQSFQGAVKRYNIELPDRELVCAPLSSPDGQSYLAAMHCAANYAFANRQVLAHNARQAFEKTLAGKVKNWHLHQVYDIAHNMGKIETHTVDGESMRVCVHRKGATRAFGPGAPGLPDEYGAGQHGHGLVGVGWDASQHGAYLWLVLPRRRAGDEPRPGQA